MKATVLHSTSLNYLQK